MGVIDEKIIYFSAVCIQESGFGVAFYISMMHKESKPVKFQTRSPDKKKQRTKKKVKRKLRIYICV